VRLRQRVVWGAWSLAPPRWELDPAFDVTRHLRWMHLGGRGVSDDVLRVAEQFAMRDFDRAHPLWELAIVEGLTDHPAAVVIKVHHTLTDGVGGVRLLLELLDLERDPAHDPEMPPEPTGHVLSRSERFGDALACELERRRAFALRATSGLVELALDPVEGARRTVDTTRSLLRIARPATRPMSPLLGARSLDVQFARFDRSLDAFRTAARQVDATVNDIFVTGLCRGLAAWHLEHDVAPHALRMGMPMSTRRINGDERIEANQFAPARCEVPLVASDAANHVREISRRLRAQREEPALALLDPLAGLLSRLPRFALTNMFANVLRAQDFVTSNVPGAPVPVHLAGAEVVAIVAFGPLGGTALNVTLLSHCGNVHIGVNLDPATIPDGGVLVACLERGVDEVLALGAPAHVVRHPGRTKAKSRARR
jgi:WS/DGAT/MGAT family acyltransferase